MNIIDNGDFVVGYRDDLFDYYKDVLNSEIDLMNKENVDVSMAERILYCLDNIKVYDSDDLLKVDWDYDGDYEITKFKEEK